MDAVYVFQHTAFVIAAGFFASVVLMSITRRKA